MFFRRTALLQQFAKELVAIQPDLILSANTPTTAALLQQTRTIPIVFANVSDPVGDGFLASLARPGGNVTGFSNMEASMAGKWVELLKEIAPSVTKVNAETRLYSGVAHIFWARCGRSHVSGSRSRCTC